MKRIIALSVFLISGIFLFNSCKKEFDHPPLKTVNDGAKLNVAALKARTPSASSSYKFGAGDTNLYGTILADETSGNIYKQTFIMDDEGGAIQLNLLNTGGFAVGDKIRINLNNIYVVNANNMIYLDSVDLGKSVVKISSGNVVSPKVVTIGEVLAGIVPSNPNSLQSQLIQLNDVEFVEKGKTFADAIGKGSLNRLIIGCGSSNTLTVRTSGYANFAGKLTPNGNGSIIAIVTQYNSTMQLTIRNYNEVQMTGTGCPPPSFTLATPVSSLNEDFSGITTANQEYSSNGWINYAEVGTAKWKTNITGSLKALKASSYGSGDAANSIWLISPPVIYSSSMTLSFKTAFGFWKSGHPDAVMAYVSTDFDGTNANSANWTPITSASYANGTGSFYPNGTTASGTINLNSISILSGYSGNFFVAFKYTGNPSYTSDIYVDDIIVQ